MSLVKKYSKDKKKCNVTFTLPKEAARGANTVLLLGEFNNWNPTEGIALVSKKEAYQTVVKLDAGKRYEYRYLVDGTWWTNDAAPDAFVSNPYGTVNSVVTLDTPTKKAIKKATVKKVVQKATAKKITAKPVAKKVTAKKAATKKTVAKTKTTKDNLKKVEGIGPKIEQLLNAAGIVTFSDLSKTKVGVLRNILKEAGSRFKMHNPSTWAKQAKMAAKGNWDALKKWQDELNGGVKK